MPQDAITPVQPPLLRLTAVLVGVGLGGAILAGWVATMRGGSFTLGLMTLAATLPGITISLLLLASRPAQPASKWPVAVLAGTMVRAMTTLLIGLGMATAMTLDNTVFLLTILGVLLIALVVEVGIVLRMVNASGAATQPASLEGARS